MQKLYSKLKGHYDKIIQNVHISSKKCDLAEIDLMCVKKGKIDIYEVKCSYRIIKAKKQLKKIRRLMPHYNIARTFFYCGSSDRIVSIA